MVEQEDNHESAWKLNQARTLKSLSSRDIVGLMQIYRGMSHEGVTSSPQDFVRDIGWRIYTEWCMSPEGKGKDHCRGYHGEAFCNFIGDETIYASNRAFEKKLLPEPCTVEALEEVRHQVLEAIAKRAVELFSAWGGKTCPQDLSSTGLSEEQKDRRNLRTNLEPYLGF